MFTKRLDLIIKISVILIPLMTSQIFSKNKVYEILLLDEITNYIKKPAPEDRYIFIDVADEMGETLNWHVINRAYHEDIEYKLSNINCEPEIKIIKDRKFDITMGVLTFLAGFWLNILLHK